MAKVTICIPVYNNLDKFKNLFNSISSQTYTDYDIVVTDNSDNDEIEEFVATLADERVTYFRNKVNVGPTRNWNKGLQLATGKYVKIMFADDWFSYPDSLSRFVEALDEHENSVLAFSGTWQVGEKEVFKRHISEQQLCLLKRDIRNLYIGNYIGAPSATIFRNEGLLFDSNLKWVVDFELYMRILKGNKKFVPILEPLTSIGVGEGQLTNLCIDNSKLLRKEYLYVMNKHHLWSKPIYIQKYLEILTIPIKKRMLHVVGMIKYSILKKVRRR